MERAKDFGIILDDVSIVSGWGLWVGLSYNAFHLQTDLSFGREYTAAVEAKQVGESRLVVCLENV